MSMKKAAFTLFLVLSFLPVFAKQTPSESVYRERPDDPFAVYFEGKSGTDVTSLLQQNINDLKERDNFGIIFIPGKISGTDRDKRDRDRGRVQWR